MEQRRREAKRKLEEKKKDNAFCAFNYMICRMNQIRLHCARRAVAIAGHPNKLF